MAFGYGMYEVGGVWFEIKVALVVLLTVLYVVQVRNIRKIQAGGEAAVATSAASRQLGGVMLLTGVPIIAAAVMSFH